MKMCRKAKRIANKEKPTIYDIRQFMSYLGWIKSADVYGAYLEYIKPHINIQYLKRRISNYDKRKEKTDDISTCGRHADGAAA